MGRWWHAGTRKPERLWRVPTGWKALDDFTHLRIHEPFDRLEDVREVVGQALWIGLHTGRASASTLARKLSGSALGVSTSTGMPSSFSSL